ncbi:MAG: hypothetical protein J0M15_00515 [Deltaproteobacteria bacterium]|nr:hypothetical protein [Deltaproteobacteria bacterium]
MKLGYKIKKVISFDEESFVINLKFDDGAVGEVDLSSISCVLTHYECN